MKLMKLILVAVIVGIAFGAIGGLASIWFPQIGPGIRGMAVGAAVGVIVALLASRVMRRPAGQP